MNFCDNQDLTKAGILRLTKRLADDGFNAEPFPEKNEEIWQLIFDQRRDATNRWKAKYSLTK